MLLLVLVAELPKVLGANALSEGDVKFLKIKITTIENMAKTKRGF
jgi:hypothetical protein